MRFPPLTRARRRARQAERTARIVERLRVRRRDPPANRTPTSSRTRHRLAIAPRLHFLPAPLTLYCARRRAHYAVHFWQGLDSRSDPPWTSTPAAPHTRRVIGYSLALAARSGRTTLWLPSCSPNSPQLSPRSELVISATNTLTDILAPFAERRDNGMVRKTSWRNIARKVCDCQSVCDMRYAGFDQRGAGAAAQVSSHHWKAPGTGKESATS